MTKKSSQFKIRLDEDSLEAFKAAAEAKGLEPSKCIRDLMAAFAAAVEQHGARNVIWPAELDYFPAQSAREQRYDNKITTFKVAEDEPSTYGGPPEDQDQQDSA